MENSKKENLETRNACVPFMELNCENCNVTKSVLQNAEYIVLLLQLAHIHTIRATRTVIVRFNSSLQFYNLLLHLSSSLPRPPPLRCLPHPSFIHATEWMANVPKSEKHYLIV